MIYTGTNTIGNDSYFIRLKDNKNTFIHFEGNNPNDPKEDAVYRAKEGIKGACIFHKKQGEGFIKHSGASNLELVRVKSLIAPDKTEN
jgi:hypothetical protein